MAAAIIAGFPAAHGAPQGEPLAAVDRQLVQDVGRVRLGEIIHAEFSLRNDREEPVAITRVRSACDCTVVDHDEEIPPGQAGVVRVDVDTARLTGPIAKSVIVWTTDPGQAAVELRVLAEVEPFIAVQPDRVRHLFGRKTVVQKLWATDGQDFKIVGVTSTTPLVEATFRQASPEERHPDGPRRQWLVESTVVDDAPTGPFTGRLIVETDHPHQSRAEVQVTGVVRKASGR